MVTQWVKDPALPLLWHRFHNWPWELLHATAKPKKKKPQILIFLVSFHSRHVSNNSSVYDISSYWNFRITLKTLA